MLYDLLFLNIGMPWPPPSEADRLKKYQENKALYKGKHNDVFRDWVRLLRDDQKATLEIILNWHKRLSKLWADLLLSEPPNITSSTSKEDQVEVDSIIDDNNLINTLYEVVIDISRYGDGLLNIYSDGKKGHVGSSQPGIWFPVVDRDNIKNVLYHVLAWTYIEGKDSNKKTYLKVQIHEKGKITKKLFSINDNKKISLQVNADEVINTGIDDFLVIPVNNVVTSDDIYGDDDYTDLDSIIQEMEIRISQISRILDKHSDPNMYGDENALDEDPDTGKVTFKGGGKFFPVSEGGTAPGYVVWDAQLEANWKELEFLLSQLYIISETSAACFGELKQGLAESGAALKRLMMAPLAKTQRIRMRIDPAAKKAIRLCSKFNGNNDLSKKPINILWQDGIPKDDREEADIMAIRTGSTGGARTISVHNAIKRLDNKTDEEVAAEMEKIAEDEMAASLMTTPPYSGNEA
ncbi:MAG: phage portal protein [Bacillota bacterium]|nr:phage portal protein [Bacillota bacterium]